MFAAFVCFRLYDLCTHQSLYFYMEVDSSFAIINPSNFTNLFPLLTRVHLYIHTHFHTCMNLHILTLSFYIFPCLLTHSFTFAWYYIHVSEQARSLCVQIRRRERLKRLLVSQLRDEFNLRSVICLGRVGPLHSHYIFCSMHGSLGTHTAALHLPPLSI